MLHGLNIERIIFRCHALMLPVNLLSLSIDARNHYPEGLLHILYRMHFSQNEFFFSTRKLFFELTMLASSNVSPKTPLQRGSLLRIYFFL